MIASQKHILLVGNFLSHARAVRFPIEDLAERLEKKGWYVLRTSSHQARWLRFLDMVHSAWRHRGLYDLAVVDLFSGLSFAWATVICGILRRLSRPYILVLHGGRLPEFTTRFQRMTRSILSDAVQVITPSLYLSREMSRYRSDITVIANGLDLSPYRYHLRNECKPSLVWLRSFHERYNPTLLPKALSLIVRDLPAIKVRMIGMDKGDGSYRRTIRTAHDLGVAAHIEFIPGVRKHDVPEMLSEADIFINTTDCESFGVSLMEAGATGLCIITTSAGEIPDRWRNRENALLVPRNDPEEIARAIMEILADPSLSGRLSRAARETAMTCDWNRIIPKWERALREATTKDHEGQSQHDPE